MMSRICNTLITVLILVSCVNKGADEKGTQIKDSINILPPQSKYDEIENLKADCYKIVYMDSSILTSYFGGGPLAEFNTLISWAPEDEEGYQLRAKAKEFLKDYRGAISDYDFAIRLDSLNPDLLVERGNIKVKLKLNIDGIHDFNQAISLDSTTHSAYFSRGLVMQYHSNNYKQAIDDYSMAIRQLNVQKKEKSEIRFNLELDLFINAGRTKVYNLKNYYMKRGMARLKVGIKDDACLDLSKAGELGMSSAYDLIKKNCN